MDRDMCCTRTASIGNRVQRSGLVSSAALPQLARTVINLAAVASAHGDLPQLMHLEELENEPSISLSRGVAVTACLGISGVQGNFLSFMFLIVARMTRRSE